ncbi:WecB/TagA/CpsF family glycosyltransferase [Aggregicoccus sp. 17bor-14]|uniref:WecB/TagA/CpsF family glycosyltransferase n=1 Tax=Myxococcaceae TaxID=31 RepID=UPI00129CA6A9|nr:MULTISPECIES: WecB/TagA/CpsF family glycosyltransferase [Myxococcaceae]MBF5042602.1 WecB/TagA/CpsF family glycosyltransferase [Simulacricoccus sp. 17bor-14]MRI88370.1 WecB/TagA/CpsF family glycosyltransferase [Aggregicoccus sp. 17bor-14]
MSAPAPVLRSPPPAAPAAPRLRLGRLTIDPVTFPEALARIEALVAARQGGSVFTPNVDHVVNVDADAHFAEAYAQVSLSLVDGTPLLWASRALGAPLPEKISGSDLVWPLMQRAAERGWRVYLLGAGPGVAQEAAERFERELGLKVVGVDSPRIAARPGAVDESAEALARLRAAAPDLVLVAFGSPKQELWIHAHAAQLAPAVAVAVGASLDFVAGRVKRAPAWMSRAGLEWLYRLGQEPRRLWRRYLVNDPKFVGILLRTLRESRRAR